MSLDNEFSREKAQKLVLEQLEQSFRKEPPKGSLLSEFYELLKDPCLSKKFRQDLLLLKKDVTDEEIAEFAERMRKEKARQIHAMARTKRKNSLAKLEKEVRSDKTISKLQKMQLIREIQKQRANV